MGRTMDLDSSEGEDQDCRQIYPFGPIPVAVGRHRADRTGPGPRVGAQVASPRGPILRPGPLAVTQPDATGQSSFSLAVACLQASSRRLEGFVTRGPRLSS